MAGKTFVPITPDVLRWALVESGLSSGEVSKAAKVDEAEFDTWLQGKAMPSTTQLKQIAGKLHRQVAVFLLPAVPNVKRPQIDFRHPIGQPARPLSPTERRFLRRAQRLQDVQAWLLEELDRTEASLPSFALSTEPESAGDRVREQLGMQPSSHLQWKSASSAFDAWRTAVERLGVTVVLFAMGRESCRGFSLWHDTSPLIAINTAWNDEARIFTLFHEFGHLVTRTNSACAESPSMPDGRDPVERWCEEFAAAVLMPRESVRVSGQVTGLRELSALARRHKVSLRAMAIRLIGLGKASWTLYREIPPASDDKHGGGGGTARNRREIRQDEIGARGAEIFVSAVQRDVISESQALDYLDIPAVEFEHLRAAVGATADRT